MSDELKNPADLPPRAIVAELAYIVEEMEKLDSLPLDEWTDDDREAWRFCSDRAADLQAAWKLRERDRAAEAVYEVQEDGTLRRIGRDGVTTMYPLRRGGWASR